VTHLFIHVVAVDAPTANDTCDAHDQARPSLIVSRSATTRTEPNTQVWCVVSVLHMAMMPTTFVLRES
jgi:hypothetical protein